MKLPPGFAIGDGGEVILSSAEYEQVRAYIRLLSADRDHARRWAAFHQADAAWERKRLRLLLKVRAIPATGVPKPVDLEPAVLPTGLDPRATDGWDGSVPGWELSSNSEGVR